MASRVEEVKVLKMVEGADKQKHADSREVSRLESIYSRYVGQIYTLALQLLADVRAAEESTVSVFVRFGREMARW